MVVRIKYAILISITDRKWYIISDADAIKQILVSKSFKYHRPDPDNADRIPSKNVRSSRKWKRSCENEEND